MVNPFIAGITHGSKSRISNPKFHPGFDEQYNNYDPSNCRRSNYNNLWVSLKQVVWRKRHPHFSFFRGIVDSDSVFNMHTAGDPFSLEVVTRAASQVLSVEVIDREIDTTSTTVSLSVFSQ